MTHSLADTIFTDKGMHLLKYFFTLSETLNDIRESSRISKKSAEQAKGRVPEKKPVFFMVFCQTGGGGSARVVKKPYCFFEKSIFFREHAESF